MATFLLFYSALAEITRVIVIIIAIALISISIAAMVAYRSSGAFLALLGSLVLGLFELFFAFQIINFVIGKECFPRANLLR